MARLLPKKPTQATSKRVPARPLPRVPLRLRLRNPPPQFVGRDRERERLVSELPLAKAMVVSGTGGIGKSSLVSSAIHSLGEDAVERTLAFAVSPTDRTGEGFLLDLVRGLSGMFDGRPVESRAVADIEDALTACIDLADAHRAIVVIDDLHHATADRACQPLLRGAAAYARRSLWVATSRRPEAHGEISMLALGGLDASSIEYLARRTSPSLSDDEIASTVRDVGGSPFWLRQRLAIGHDPRGGEALLEGLSTDAIELCRTLSLLEVPVSRAQVSSLLSRGDGASLVGELEVRGLVENVPGGVSLHAVARTSLAVGADEVKVAKALESANEILLSLEAVRLFVRAGAIEEAAQVIERVRAALFSEGAGPRLWQIIGHLEDPLFTPAKLACTADLGSREAIAWANGEPPPIDPEDRLVWLTLLADGGDRHRAASLAVEMAESCIDEDRELAARAALVALRACVSGADIDRALSVVRWIDESGATTTTTIVLTRAFEARALIFTGENDRALSIVTELARRTSGLEASVQREVEHQRAAVLMNLGRARSAHDAYQRANRGGAVTPEQLGARERLVRGSHLALEFGDLREGRRLLGELEPVAHRSLELHVFYCMNCFRLTSAEGDLIEARRHLEDFERAVESAKSGYWAAWAASPLHYLGILDGTPFDDSTAAKTTDFPLTRALAAWHAVTSSGDTTRLDSEPATGILDTAIALAMARCRGCCLRGEGAAARRAAEEAISLAEDEGLLLWEADARVCLCEALYLSRSPDLSRAVRALEVLAKKLASSRISGEVAFFDACLSPGSSIVPALERLVGSVADPAPPFARRSRALLGHETVLSRIDHVIVERARSVMSFERLAPSAPRRKGAIGIDELGKQVWLPSGEVIAFATRPVLLKLLSVLFDRGGAASKEELVTEVWGVSDYHPLRDDKRLQVTVRRIRVLLETDPQAPALIETTETGYRFAPDHSVYRT